MKETGANNRQEQEEELQKVDSQKAEDEQETETDSEVQEEQDELEEGPSLKDVIKEQATEDETPLSNTFTLRKILGGDILSTSTIRRQIWVFMLITFFVIIYISNRYSCQQNLIEIDRLQKELLHAKYKALSSNSQLTEKCRESHVLDMLQENKDSLLKIANQPPYIITIPEE